MSTINNDYAEGNTLPNIITFNRTFFGVELFHNTSNHPDSDGFLLMSNANVVFMQEEGTGCKYIDVFDTKNVSRKVRFDINMITKYSFNKITSGRGNHKMGRLVFEIPLDPAVKFFLGVTLSTSKFIMKFSRDNYDNLRQAYFELLRL